MARMTASGGEASNKREAILGAALCLFADQGFDSTSMADIARDVGVTKGTLYHYFSGKVDILEDLIEDSHYSTDDITEAMSDTDRSLHERLTQVGCDYIDLICEKPDLGHVLLRESLGNAKHDATEGVKQKFVRRYYGRIDVLEACLRNEPELESASDARIRAFAELFFDSLSLFWIRRVLVEHHEPGQTERHAYVDGLVGWLVQSEGWALA